MTVYKTIIRRGKNGNGFGKVTDWVAVINGRNVAGFSTKRSALAAVAEAAAK